MRWLWLWRQRNQDRSSGTGSGGAFITRVHSGAQTEETGGAPSAVGGCTAASVHDKNKYENPAGKQLGGAASAHVWAALGTAKAECWLEAPRTTLKIQLASSWAAPPLLTRGRPRRLRAALETAKAPCCRREVPRTKK